MSADEITLNVTSFKAKSLTLLEDLARGRLAKITVTKRGKPLAVVTPPADAAESAKPFYGSMKGRSRALADVDLTEPIYDGPWPDDPLLEPDDAAA